VADVPAELRQRDEDLRRVGDDRTAAQAPGLGEQLFERPVEHAMSIRAGGKVTGVDAHVLVPLKALDPKSRLGSVLTLTSGRS
jgi:hypothetical protein